jgi:hypothetical protein
MDPVALTKMLEDGGWLLLFVIVIITGLRRDWVWGYQLKEAEDDLDAMRRERDEWKTLALSQTSLAQGLAEIAQRRGA